MIDTSYYFETPEGVELKLDIAGPVVRCYAFLADTAIRIGLLMLASLILGYLGKIGTGIVLIVFFLLEWFYPVVFEVLFHGQTPGKKIFNLKVVHDNGTPVSFLSSIIRNLLRAVDFLPVLYVTGIITMLFNGHFQRLGDISAGTMVVYSSEGFSIPDIPKESPKVFPVPLSLEEQQSIIELAERSSTLSDDRIMELANLLKDILEADNEDAIRELYKVANGLSGAS